MKQEQKYYGNYVGIVIQNNDPLGKGRVKVYVPHVSPNVYNKWNELSEDKKFKFLGKNVESDLSRIAQQLREILPWCVCAAPIIGESTSGRYNASLDYGSTSDSSYYGLSGFQSGNPKYTTGTNEVTTDGTGEKEGSIYEKYKTKLTDPFSDPAVNNVNQANINSHEYVPSTYSNKAKGSFSIPAVGSHLWVFFYDGDPHYPVYFAAAFGKDDWNELYDFDTTALDYPGSFENTPLSGDTPNKEQYRNKTIINQKGGTIEVVNSDNRELLKFTHYSGSFKSFTNSTNVELAIHNDQKMVLEDQFYTVKGNRNTYTGKDEDNNIKGNHYLKIGNLREEYVNEWKNIVGTFANIKQLFDIRRAQKIESLYLKYTSTLQTRDGTFAKCPVCLGSKGKEYTLINNVSSIQELVPSVTSGDDEVYTYATVSQPLVGSIASKVSVPPVSRCPVCKGSGKSPSSMNGNWVTESLKDYNTLKNLYKSKIDELAQIESKMGIGGSQIIDITKHKVETIGLVMNDFGNIRVDTVGKISNSQVLIDELGVYVSQQESPLVEYVHVDDMPGGNYTLNVCNRFNLQVGAGGMNFKSYGPVNISGTIANFGGTQVNISGETEVNITAQNRLTLESDLIILKNKSGGQVLVDSNFGVNGNAIVRGGMHVDGELSVNHITAPYEIQMTELMQLFGKLLSGLSFQCHISGVEPGPGVDSTITLTADSNDNKVQCYDHAHHFKNIPLTLVNGNNQVRMAAIKNNSKEINAASPITNEYKPN